MAKLTFPTLPNVTGVGVVTMSGIMPTIYNAGTIPTQFVSFDKDFTTTFTDTELNTKQTEELRIITLCMREMKDWCLGRPYLAGGALRDLIHDVKIKDWDIYFVNDGLTADRLSPQSAQGKRNIIDKRAAYDHSIRSNVALHPDLFESCVKNNSNNINYTSVKCEIADDMEDFQSYSSTIEEWKRPFTGLKITVNKEDKEGAKSVFELNLQLMWRPDVLGVNDLIYGFDWKNCSRAVTFDPSNSENVYYFGGGQRQDSASGSHPIGDIKNFYRDIYMELNDIEAVEMPKYSLMRGVRISQKLKLSIKSVDIDDLILRAAQEIEESRVKNKV